ncbi:MAG: hypothetical protein V2I67_15760 [Thermoanaerobaculales bacterium]|jgi:photosystem II stability/assembly factor-like uncharacterized protein|nr:hypothetical protein [Thermoanaerobaculales bacterium]
MRRVFFALAVVLAVVAADAAVVSDEMFNSMSFRLVGPFRGGRVTAVTGVPGDPMTYYMGTTGGGVWKTTNAGGSWKNVSDAVRELDPEKASMMMGQVDPELVEAEVVRPPVGGMPQGPQRERREGDVFGTASIGAVAVAPSDPNIVWAGTGSACPRGNISVGDGIYKSTDAGESWRHMGLDEAGQIGRVVVHPTDPDIVYAAALGRIFGPNAERGVYRTTDGGLSWTKVLFVSENAGAVDLAMDSTNPRVLYAATWEARRSPWNMISGGPGSGVYKTTDGGNTWTTLGKGLPEGELGRIAVAVSPAFPKRVWVMVEHDDGGLFRSDDGGRKFRRVNANRELRQRAWYYTHIEADPKDANTVYALNVFMWRSDDGGTTFRPVRTPHGDNHALWINPDNPLNMVQGNDGGANVSFDGGRSWSTQQNQPTSEIYRLTVDDQWPYWLYGGQQDNTAVAIPSRTSHGSIGWKDWYAPAGCETATVAVDPRNPEVTYGGCYGGSLNRFDRALGFQQQVMAWPQMAVGQQAADLRYRFQWNAPVRISPHDPEVLYHCSNVVHRTRDEGATWEVISPDLTRDDETKQGYAGEPITRDNTGVEVYGTIFAFEESPLQQGLLWAGSDDGLVHLSTDDGATWKDITPAEMPEWGTVNSIELSAHAPGRAFMAVHRYRTDDFSPVIFKTDNFGSSWTRIDAGIPKDHFVRVVREDPERRGLLFAGTEFGLFVSLDDGASWQPFQLDLPVTPITDMAVKRGDLVVATQGRSFWILDDLSPLRQMAAAAVRDEPHLFRPRPAVRWADGSGGRRGSGDQAEGKNPPFGAFIHYVLPEPAEGEDLPEVRLEILGADGEVLRSMSSEKPERQAPNVWRKLLPHRFDPPKLDARPGANRWVWNLRLHDAAIIDEAVLWGSAAGPMVAPGEYRVRMTVGEWSADEAFQVVPDPRRPGDAEIATAQFELAHEIWSELNRSHELLERLEAVRDQVNGWAERTDDEAIGELAAAIVEELGAVEGEIREPDLESSQDMLNMPSKLDNQLVYLKSVVEDAPAEPTAASRERFAELVSQLDEIVGRFDEILEIRVPELEALLDEVGAPRIGIE